MKAHLTFKKSEAQAQRCVCVTQLVNISVLEEQRVIMRFWNLSPVKLHNLGPGVVRREERKANGWTVGKT